MRRLCQACLFLRLFAFVANAQSIDLELVRLEPSKTVLAPGETFTVSYDIRNHGPDAASRITAGLAYFICIDSPCTYVSMRIPLSYIAAGDTWKDSVSLTAPNAAGRYIVRMIADAWGAATDRTQKEFTIWVGVSPPPPAPTSPGTISVRVRDAVSGAGLEGVTLTLSAIGPGDQLTVVAKQSTGLDGSYSFPNLEANRPYLLAAAKPGYEFTPSGHRFESVAADEPAVELYAMRPLAEAAPALAPASCAAGRVCGYAQFESREAGKVKLTQKLVAFGNQAVYEAPYSSCTTPLAYTQHEGLYFLRNPETVEGCLNGRYVNVAPVRGERLTGPRQPRSWPWAAEPERAVNCDEINVYWHLNHAGEWFTALDDRLSKLLSPSALMPLPGLPLSPLGLAIMWPIEVFAPVSARVGYDTAVGTTCFAPAKPESVTGDMAFFDAVERALYLGYGPSDEPRMANGCSADKNERRSHGLDPSTIYHEYTHFVADQLTTAPSRNPRNLKNACEDTGLQRTDDAESTVLNEAVADYFSARIRQSPVIAGFVRGANTDATQRQPRCLDWDNTICKRPDTEPDHLQSVALSHALWSATLPGYRPAGKDARELDRAVLDVIRDRPRTIPEFVGLLFAKLPVQWRGAIQPFLNRVEDSSFEPPQLPAVDKWTSYSPETGLGSWTVRSGSVDVIGTWLKCLQGKQCMDLSGSTQQAGSVSQDIQTIPGRRYVLRFAATGSFVGPPPEKLLTVRFGDNWSQEIKIDKDAWKYYVYYVAASSNTTRLQFISGNNTNDGPVIDDVGLFLLP